MIRNQHRPKFMKDKGLHSVGIFKGTFGKEVLALSNGKKCKNMKKSINKITSNEGKQSYQLGKSTNSPKRRREQKQNNVMNHNTPEQDKQFSPKINTDEFDQISQIKYISKQYSSIRGSTQNDLDCISDTIAANQLEDFSPLLEPTSKGDQQDFILEMYDLQETEHKQDHGFIYEAKEQVQVVKNEIFGKPEIIGNKIKVGKIKRNKVKQAQVCNSLAQNVVSQIRFIFNCLDCANIGILCKSNCTNELLTTELNYLIGSLLNSIKTKGKQCEYFQFQRQFKKLIEDSQSDQLFEIFINNRKKQERKINNNFKNNNVQQYTDDFLTKNKFVQDQEIICPNFNKSIKVNTINIIDKVTTDRLVRMNQKVNMYLLKNNLIVSQKPVIESYQITSRLINEPSIYNTTKQASTRQNKNSEESVNINESEVQKSSQDSLSFNTSISLRSDSQTITGIAGSSFELNFLQLNKHL